MSDKRNALAELAKRLDIGSFTCGDIRKAQCIVAELAKVRDTDNFVGVTSPNPFEASCVVENCRAIAEEGER